MGRQTKGSIFLRGNNYHLLYYVNGIRKRVSLSDEAGQPITKGKSGLAKARAAADLILHPLTVRQAAERIEKVAEALATAEQKAAAAEQEAANSQAAIAKGWELFYSCPKRPRSCRRHAMDEIPRTSTAANYRAYYQRFADWLRRKRPKARLLADVTEADAQAFIESVKRDCASGTVNKYLTFMKCFYNIVTAAGKIACDNPFAEIEPEEHTFNSKKPLTVEQIAGLLDNAEGELKILFALGYFSGLRRGDCCTLLWSEVDLLRGVVERIPNKIASRVKDKAQAVVKVGIPPLLAGLLEATPPEERKGYVLPEMAELYTTGKDYTIANRIAAHFQKCGIETRMPGTGSKYRYDGKKKVYDQTARAIVVFGFHSLRYSYISHNAERGTPQAIIQRNAGHQSPAMTEHYTRISDDAARQYAGKLLLPGADGATAEEAERDTLRKLADTLDIEAVRQLLAGIQE